jgi:hypothetical protein
MEESKAAWDEVGSLFTGLGLKLKEHFAQAATSATADDAGTKRSDAAAADAVRDAIRKLGAALDDAVEAVSGAAKDPAITDDVRKVGQSVMHAFQTTFADVSEDVRHAFGRARGEQK